jgi:GNAT superfamily N-acetyltransferase
MAVEGGSERANQPDSIEPSSTSTSSSSNGQASSSSSSTSTSSSGGGAPWRGPKLLEGVARWAAQPETEPSLGVSYGQRGILGVAQLDSFGDVVPPKALNAQRDGAIGWIKREGEGLGAWARWCLGFWGLWGVARRKGGRPNHQPSPTSNQTRPPTEPNRPAAGICYLSNVAVCAAARRRGIARRLMAEAEGTAADWGFRCVALVRTGWFGWLVGLVGWWVAVSRCG